MNKNKELLFWKAAALGIVLVYLYKVTKANGGTLSGNKFGVNIRPEKVMGLASQFVPEEYRPQARKLGLELWNRFNQGGN